MTGDANIDPGRAQSNQDELVAEIVRLRATLARAGIDADHLAAGHARAAEAGRAELLEAGAANADLETSRAALAAGEGRYRAVLESATDYAIFTSDLKGRITGWNTGARNVLGWEETEVLGRDGALIFTPEDREAGAPQREMHRALEKGHSADLRWHVKRDGTRFWAEGQLTPLRDGGSPQGFLKILRDHTKARLAEERVRESEAFLRTVLDASLDCTVVVERDGRLSYVNASGLRLLELDDGGPDAVSGHEWAALWPEPARTRVREAVAAALAGEPSRFEAFGPTARGTPKWWDVSVAPVPAGPEDGGKVARIVAMARDVTEARRAERALRASEERHRAVIESATEYAIFTLDRQGSVTSWNSGAERILGWAEAEIIGRGAAILYTPEDREAGALATEMDMALAEGHVENELWMLRRDGTRFWAAQTLARLLDHGGEERGFLKILRDRTDQRLADERLRASEAQFRATFEQAAVGIAHVGLDGRWLRVNGRLCAMLGYTEAELLARTFQEITHPDDVEPNLAHIHRLVSGEVATYSMEKRYLRRDGGIVWGALTSALLRDPDTGAPRHFVSIIEDITPRKRAEAALRESEARLQLTLSNAQIVGLWDWDIARDLVHADERFARLYGVDPARAAAGAPSEDFVAGIHPDDRARVGAEVAHAVQTGEPFACEYRLVQADGSVRHVLARGRCTYDAAGAPALFPGVVIDITEQREAEERLRLAQRAGGIGAFEIDATRRLLTVSEEFCQLWGIPQQNTVPLDVLLAMIHPQDRPRVATSYPDIPQDALSYVEYRITRADTGEERWIARRGEARSDLASPNGDGATRFVGVVYDITERKRMEDELRRLNEGLEQRVAERTAELMAAEATLRQSQKMEAVGQLTGGIAHDFNNMLQGISGGLEMMRRRVEQGRAEEAGRYLEGACRTVERAAALTHRLLAFARRQALAPKPIEPDKLVEGMAELIRRTVGPAVPVELRSADGIWTVLCDPNQLENALLNLAINARDAMPDGGTLTISTQHVRLSAVDVAGEEGVEPGDYVEIAVTDTGAGMDEATRSRAFEPFFTTKPLGQGTGLGLSQLYGFARQSDGAVRLDSVPGQGTTVRLYLPRHARVGMASEVGSGQPEALQAGAGETVLLVEDEAQVRELTAEALRELGYDVLEASDGPAALRVLHGSRSSRVDLLVTDVGLPGGLNGRQVAEIAREARPGLKVLFITGYAGSALDGQLAPGMAVIGKPFTLDALAAKVRSMVEGEASARS